MSNLTTNEEYKQNLRKWQMVRDCVNDEVKHKACRDASCEYERTSSHGSQGYIVRAPGIEDEAYYTFANRAVFKNYTGNTLDILCGAAMMRPYKLTGESVDDVEQELPESIQYIEGSFTRSGIGYYDSLKERIREVSSVGRYGLWADFPSSTEGMTQKEIREKGLFARAQGFTAENIKDWSEAIINGRKQLNYVKLSECYTQMVVSGSDFRREAFSVTYELFLDEEGLYSVKRDDGTTVNIYSPTLGNGQRLDWIPFQFYGSVENTPSVDPLPMFKISEINIALFNNDATFRQAMWYFGAPTATFSLNQDVTPSEFMKINGIAEGSSPTFGGSAYVGCDIGLAQISVDSMLVSAMDKDVESMAQIGAQIISTGGNETAEAARIRKSSSMASLGGIVANIEAGDRNVIKWMMMFNNESGQPDEFMLELNRKFYDERIEPQMLQQLVTMNFQGKLPDEYLFKVLKDNKFALDGDSIVEYIERIGDIPNTGMNLDEE